MNYIERAQNLENKSKVLDELREDIRKTQKSGLPFIIASVFIWIMISVVCGMNLNISTKNLLIFCCSCPLMPIAMIAGKILGVDIFDKANPLGKVGLLFTLNQMIYLLIVMWAFNAVPEKMVMVYAIVFGAHLLPYSWLYKNKMYLISSIVLPILALALGLFVSMQVMAIVFAVYELVFSLVLFFGK